MPKDSHLHQGACNRARVCPKLWQGFTHAVLKPSIVQIGCFVAPASLCQDKYGKTAPSNLSNGELFVLVAYALDVRKKDSNANWDMNFSSRLSRVARHHPGSDDPMSVCLGNFSGALEKRLTKEPQTLY